MPRSSLSSSVSTSSTLSCINCVLSVAEAIQNSPRATSLTPPTSNTDAASISSSNDLQPENNINEVRRVQRVRTSVDSYNENVLSGSARLAVRPADIGGASRAVSGKMRVSASRKLQRGLVPESMKVLNLDWRVESTYGEMTKSTVPSIRDHRGRKSTRLEILKRASCVMNETHSVLGKRGHEAVGSGNHKLHDSGRRASLRPRTQSLPVCEGRVQKRMRLSIDNVADGDCSRSNPKPQITTRSRTKRWLSQGLYVGQERDFDPRLTESKNKLKRASTSLQQKRKSAALPLPMFAGQRTLELGRDFRLPFAVFSPLPPGQPKPEEWRKTQKNVFVGDAGELWKKTKRLEHSTCICEMSSGCDESCFNRFMFYECDNTNCNIGAELCTNRSFEDLRKRCKAGGKYNVGVEVIKTLDRGYGVRSNRTFTPYQIIVEYTGEIITQDECDNRMKTIYKDNECFYLMVFDQNMIIDATRGSIARFVNHSCEPNCRMVKWTVAGKPRMALFAGEKGIMTGDELTYDYNFDPFSSKNIQECRCGAVTCRGVLGPRPKDHVSSKSNIIKGDWKPTVTVGLKRKFPQEAEKVLDFVGRKKPRLAVSSSVKPRLKNLGRRSATHLVKSRVLTSLVGVKTKLVKTSSGRARKQARVPVSIHGSAVRVTDRPTFDRTHQ